MLQAAIPQGNFLLISKRLDLRNQVASRGCRQSGGNKVANVPSQSPMEVDGSRSDTKGGDDAVSPNDDEVADSEGEKEDVD